jgi:hypothetical protein
MRSYVILLNWTDQGARHSRETIKRARAFHNLIESRHGDGLTVPDVVRRDGGGGCEADQIRGTSGPHRAGLGGRHRPLRSAVTGQAERGQSPRAEDLLGKLPFAARYPEVGPNVVRRTWPRSRTSGPGLPEEPAAPFPSARGCSRNPG